MGMAGQLLDLCNYGRRTLLSMMGFLAAMVVFSQFWALPSGKYLSTLSPGEEHSPLIMIKTSPPSQNFVTNGNFDSVEGVGYNANNMGEHGQGNGLTLRHEISGLIVASGKDFSPIRKPRVVENEVKQFNIMHNNSIKDRIEDGNHMDASNSFSNDRISVHKVEPLGNRSIISAINISSQVHNISQVMELEARIKEDSSMIERYVKKMRGATITLSEMNTMLRSKPAFSTTVRRRGSAAPDRQLLSASFQIKNAPVLRSVTDLHAPLFRNVSVFKRSYDLMERLLKIYVYKEGEKPIFHNPRLRGLYAAEGWFMKLLLGSKRFTVRDPRKAHLYYMAFSSDTLRATLYDEKSRNVKNLERYLADYVDLIKARYYFWNKTGGADHFFIACHDWGSRITRLYMSNCIRGLCNANVARGFTIGKDVSVPVTYIRSGNDPARDIGGKPPSERDILVFFAGQLHGYLRPLLLQYWENKVPDMKIFGPLPRDIQGKAVYRDYMKSSKYCICARGYEVHTPRVVESIFYECVPVIISDNHVPPFFEVLDWEAFAVFVQEKDIPNLRNILLSIPEERYLVMQHNVRKVQRHFIWHKTPKKYDLFHMVLHSVWYNRVSQIRPG